MKKLKRIFSALLIGAMALTLLVGCGGSGGSTGSSVQYMDESSAILNSFIDSSKGWAANGNIEIIGNEALRSLTEKWAGDASLVLDRLCNPDAWEDEDSFGPIYLKRPFEYRCENILIEDGILNDDSRMDVNIQVIEANNVSKDQLNAVLTGWLTDQEHIGSDQNYTPSDAALHVYLATSPTNENQKAWVVFLVVAGPFNT